MAGSQVTARKLANDKTKSDKLATSEDANKMEKKRAKLLVRSQKLERKAQKLLAEAKKAADEYADLTKALEEQANTSSKRIEFEDELDTTSVESTSSSSDSNSDGGAAIAASKSKNGNKTTKAKAKLSRKRKHTGSDSESSDDTSDSESEAERKANKMKKSRKGVDLKAKKGGGDKKERKKAKTAKQKITVKGTDCDSDSDSSRETRGVAAGQNKPEGWHVTDLDGGSARQSKFLRLLGGKKQGMSLATVGRDAKSASESSRAETIIQRQFEKGMKIKNDGGSQRRGLGLGA